MSIQDATEHDIKYKNTDINGAELKLGDKVIVRDNMCWHNGRSGEVTKLSNYLDWYGKVVYNVTVTIQEDKRHLEFLYWPMQLEKKGE